jgi:hypothetical protein
MSGTTQGIEHAPVALPGLEKRESSDGYYAVVLVLNEHWRVIDSCEPYPYRQWILQYRGNNDPTGWRGKSFHQIRAAMERSIREKVGLDVRLDLPDKTSALRVA